MLRILAHSPP